MTNTNHIGQIYLNDGEIDTIFCPNNYLSFISKNCEKADLFVKATNEKSETILNRKFKLKNFEAKSFSISKIFKENKISSSIGLFVCDIIPEYSFPAGKNYPHFFTLFKGQNGSISMVHPQSAVGGKPYSRDEFWVSSQIINSKPLKRLRILQANHSNQPKNIDYYLVSEGGKSITKALTIKPLTSNFIDFDLEDEDKNFRFKANSLPVGNGKPLLMRVFKDNSFSIIHA